ncbi:G1 family glutamic endopeptidase [Streptomyces sp. NPDC048277]|uniref:G1 family glutamic endopeptidase n=1 Tax=Streptomyces sp. NPDC048277 TaxID=3155027 RepID=UPI003401AD0B
MLRTLRIFLVALGLAAAAALPLATSANAAVAIPDSGYISISSTTSYYAASAEWNQPTGSCTSVDSAARFWVGVGGFDSDPAAWVGTDSDCSGGSPVCYGWYRPPGSSDLVSFGNAISAHDVMVASVSCSSTTCTLQLEDSSANWTVSTTQPLSGTPHSAEAMISAGALPLTNFGTATLANVLFNDQLATSFSPVPLIITRDGRALDSVSDLHTFTYSVPLTGYSNTFNYFSGTWVSAT